MLRERESMLRALQLETSAALATRHAVAVQARRTVELLDGELLPAADAAVYAAFAAYRVGRVDFSTLVDARLRLLEAQTSRIAAVSEHNRAVADIDYLAGRVPAGTEELP
jgi:outer membrane protein TolC